VTPVALPRDVRPGGRFDTWQPRPPAYVVCDVDGTLVGPQADAAVEVVHAVERATAAGLRVGIATGRMRAAAEPLCRQLHAPGPHILHNGAEVRDGDETVAVWSLTPEQIDGLLAAAHDLEGAVLEVYTESGFHVSQLDERARAHWDILGQPPLGVLERAGDLHGVVVPKATFTLYDRSLTPAISATILALGMLPGPAGSPRTPTLAYVNATHPDADKGRSLQVAAAHIDTALEDTVAIGDADNDLSMLAVAGTAIAMGQAPDNVRAAAHLVVPDVDAHGVAVALDACTTWRRAR